MMQYTLDKRSGKKKYQCPGCGHQRTFTRYIHFETFEDLDENVGICDRENNCAYHYTPKQFFMDNPDKKTFQKISKYKMEELPKRFDVLEKRFLELSLHNLNSYSNHFFAYISGKFGEEKARETAELYRLGNSNKYLGAIVFWYIDIEQQIRYGKIMLYNAETGKRVKQPYIHIASVPDELIKNGYLKAFEKSICLFGEHLLRDRPSVPVAIVESEKTAIIMSVFSPKYIWLAAGGSGWLNVEKCKVLKGRKVVLFPDLGKCFDVWSEKAKEIRQALGLNISVSVFLKENVKEDDWKEGFDIADYFLRKGN